MFDTFISDIKMRLEQPLPGRDAQLKFARPYREMSAEVPLHARTACVLILFYPIDEIPHFVLIERQTSERPGDRHGGQISFPGGKTENMDATLAATALREAEEEIGVPAHRIEIIGRLSELYIPVSNFIVHPFVGYMPEAPRFDLQPEEVREVFEVPVSLLLDKTIRHRMDIRAHDGLTLKDVPYFRIRERVVWGATAMMLGELLDIL